MVAFEAALDLLAGPERPTALLCSKDEFALQAMMAAAARGLRVLEDLSIMGYDDMRVIAPATRPGLTTVAPAHLEMGRRAAAAAIGRAQAGGLAPCPLVARASTTPPPGAG